MCGRNSVNLTAEELAKKYDADRNQSSFNGSYNIAPGNKHPVIRQGSVVLEDMQWNFVPEWADEYKEWKNKSVINSRLETVKENNLFKDAYENKRCIIPSSGFYEWKETKMGKQPYRITPKDSEVFHMAGIWSKFERDGEEVHTFSILTMGPNEKMAELHDRMPVILREGREKEWINENLEKREIHKYPSDLMEVQKSSKKVNDPSNDSEQVLNPDSRQKRLGESK